jgi:hypothetical protein
MIELWLETRRPFVVDELAFTLRVDTEHLMLEKFESVDVSFLCYVRHSAA